MKTLEELIGSQSLFGTVMTQVTMQSWSYLSVAILVLWVFSPLGGQASLRTLDTEYRNITANTTIAYLNMTRQISGFTAGYSSSLSAYAIDALYNGCLISPKSTKLGTQDSWENVKIPRIEELEATQGNKTGVHWLEVPANSENVTYSSLLGIPIAGIPLHYNSSFMIESYYYDVQCPVLEKMDVDDEDWLTPLEIPFTDSYNTSTIWGLNSRASFYLSSYTNFTEARIEGNDTSPSNLVFLSRSNLNESTNTLATITLANCTMQPTFVESKVQCEGQNCRVSAMRRQSNSPSGQVLMRYLPLSHGYSESFSLYSSNLMTATPGSNPYSSTPTEQYIYGNEYFPFAHGNEIVALYE
jgi:hypothetical protein